MISYEEFSKLEITIGEILSVEVVENADKLLKLEVHFGLKSPTEHAEDSPDQPEDGSGEERDIRQIVSGIREYFEDPEELVGKRCPFLTNLEPRIIRGLESQGMILAGKHKDTFALLLPSNELPAGTRIA